LVVSTNQSVVLVLTAQPFENNFQPFLKTPKYKTIGCFDKTIGCFSLRLKNTFLLKGLRMPMLWIQSRVDYKTQSTPDPI